MGKSICYEHPQISHHLLDCAMKHSVHKFYKKLFHISKCLALNAKKTLQLKIAVKRISTASYVNIYSNIFPFVVCDVRN